MGRRCCITGCTSRSSAPEHHGVTYHSYPLDANIRAVWIKNTRLQSDRNITKSVLVCSRHFRRADFQPMKSGKYLLKQRVFPTVFPWGKIENTTNLEAAVSGGASDIPTDGSGTTATQTATIIPTVLTTPTADAATTATVEATIAQIMAETAELNAAAGIKRVAASGQSDASTPLGKRQASETNFSLDESPAKQPRSTVESTPVLPIAANVSPGTRFESISVFNPGARLEAQDFNGAWHAARVVEVDNDDREVLIKFERSGKHHKGANLGIEEWIPMNSTRLRQKVSTKPIPIFDLEEKVMARWTGARRFPATIKKILGNDMYEVLFDDGFIKNVRAAHMTKVLPKAADAAATVAPKTTLTTATVTTASTPPVVGTSYSSEASKPKKVVPVATESSATKVKRAPPGPRRDWPLLSLDKLDIASLNLPEIPKDGEWTCHWVNDQPIGKEGYLIVGEHKKPTVVVEDWRLPPGWVKHMYQRSNVLGKWDVILVTPNGKRFRSKADLKTYLEEQGQVYNPDIYDFSIHRRRAKDINAYAFTQDYSPQQPKKQPSFADREITKSADTTPTATAPTTAAVDVLASTSSNYIEAPVVTLIPPMELMTPPVSTSMKKSPDNVTASDVTASKSNAAPTTPTTATATTSDNGFALIGGLKVQIVDNLFRCPQEGCSKNFRKENHLQIHVKHYHADLIKLLGDCPKMQELAEKRTLGTPDANEPLPKNQIPNQQFFAKLHQQDLEQSRAHRRSLGTPAASALTAASAGTTEEAASDAAVKVEPTQSPTTASTHITASDISPIDIKTEEPGGSADNTAALNTTTDLSTITNTTADSSIFELSVVSSANDESAAELPSTTTAVVPSKRSRFSPSKRTPGSRKSNRQRTTRRYLTAAQATAGAPLPPVVTADSGGVVGNFSAGDFEETRHSFNATPDAKHVEGTVVAATSKKRKAIAAPATPLSSLDSPVTADSGSSSFQPLPDDPNGGALTIATPQYIKENGELIKIVRMRQEEIINCLCSYGEEDGLMIQCELCLCWQHGICNGIDKESDVPDKYVCYICRNPQRGRESMRFKHDQDWLYEGKLPVASYHNPNPEHMTRFELLKKSHTLTGNLVELKRFMHSLRVKINIANNKGHPKMYLWAKKWDEEEQKTEIKSEQRVQSEDQQLQSETPIKIESSVESQETKLSLEGNTIDSKDSPTSSPAKRIKLEPATTPERAAVSAAPPLPLVPNIPQPEAPIEPVECQNRLLEHIKVQQRHVMERLSNIEAEIDELEKLDTLPDLKSADISTTKDALSTFIKELEIMKQISKINALENLKQSMNDNSVVIK